MKSRTADSRRKRLIQLIHVGRSKIGLADDNYRALLEGVTGKSSSADMTVAELETVLQTMRKLGFVAAGSGEEKGLAVRPENVGDASPRQIYYIKGLWALASRKKSEESLKAIIKRIAGVDDIRFVPKRSASAVILALRDIAERAGYDPDGPEGKV